MHTLSSKTLFLALTGILSIVLASLLFATSAYAYSYPSPLTSAGATTVTGQRCTGAQVASIGSANGTGPSPSVDQIAYGLLGSYYTGGLPANYNATNAYCIQAHVTVIEIPEDPGPGPGPGGGSEAYNGNDVIDSVAKMFSSVAEAQTFEWSVVYTVHTGATKAAAANRYALTYVAAPPATPTASLTASPSSITQGNSSVLTWSSTNATSCAGTGFATGNATSGSVSVSPNSTTSYTVTCTGPGGSANQSRTVTVTAPIVSPTISSFTATPASITTGNSSTLAWSSTNAATCVGTGFNTGNATSGSVSVSPTNTTTYSITCTGATGSPPPSVSQGVTVTVTAPSISANLTATPASIASGNSSTLTWSSTAADSCSGIGFPTGGATSGSFSVSPTSTLDYMLTCNASSGSSGGGTWEWEIWYTGGTQQTLFFEQLHNNGEQSWLCRDAAANFGYTYWNNEFIETEMSGDAGYPIIFVRCIGVNGPTGTIAKPNYQTGFCDGLPGGSCRIYSYYSGNSLGGGGGVTGQATDSATVTVSGGVPQCSDGVNNDGSEDALVDYPADPGCTSASDPTESPNPGQEQCQDGLDNDNAGGVDFAGGDPSCDSPTDTTEDGETAIECTVNATNPPVGGTVLYTANPVGSYTWTPSNASYCTQPTGNTMSCTFPAPGYFTNRATDGGVSDQCPNVTIGCGGTPEVELLASASRVEQFKESFQLTVSGTGIDATSCTITNDRGTSPANITVAVNACNIGGAPITIPFIETQTTFTLTCGGAESSVTVNVVPYIKEF